MRNQYAVLEIQTNRYAGESLREEHHLPLTSRYLERESISESNNIEKKHLIFLSSGRLHHCFQSLKKKDSQCARDPIQIPVEWRVVYFDWHETICKKLVPSMKRVSSESGPLSSFFVFSAVEAARKMLLMFNATHVESITTSRVQALHRIQFHLMLSLLEQNQLVWIRAAY